MQCLNVSWNKKWCPNEFSFSLLVDSNRLYLPKKTPIEYKRRLNLVLYNFQLDYDRRITVFLLPKANIAGILCTISINLSLLWCFSHLFTKLKESFFNNILKRAIFWKKINLILKSWHLVGITVIVSVSQNRENNYKLCLSS